MDGKLTVIFLPNFMAGKNRRESGTALPLCQNPGSKETNVCLLLTLDDVIRSLALACRLSALA